MNRMLDQKWEQINKKHGHCWGLKWQNDVLTLSAGSARKLKVERIDVTTIVVCSLDPRTDEPLEEPVKRKNLIDIIFLQEGVLFLFEMAPGRRSSVEVAMGATFTVNSLSLVHTEEEQKEYERHNAAAHILRRGETRFDREGLWE